MSNKNLIIPVVIACLIIILVEFFIRKEPKIPGIQIDTVMVYDTTYIIKTFKGKDVPGKTDTLYIDSTDVNKPEPILYADLDPTQIVNETGDTATVSLRYVFPPINRFQDIQISMKARIIEKTREILKTVTEIEEIPFYANPYFWTTLAEFIIIVLMI